METVAMKSWPIPLPTRDVNDFPDFIVHRLAQEGAGLVEAQFPQRGEVVSWQYCPRSTGTPMELAQLPSQLFRPVLARFAILARIDPYGGHVSFAVQPDPHWPVAAVHRFSLFLCNAPAMGFWIRLYLYEIDPTH